MDNKNIKRAILVDTAALSEAAFDIIVNFERMLNRRIPDVDIKRWLYAAACDGKFVVSDEDVYAVLLKEKAKHSYRNLNFNGIVIGEESRFSCEDFNFRVDFAEYEGSSDHAFMETLEKLMTELPGLEEIVCVPGEDICQYAARILSEHRRLRATVLSMESLRGGGFGQEYLSCSISYALGVTDREIESNGTPVEDDM